MRQMKRKLIIPVAACFLLVIGGFGLNLSAQSTSPLFPVGLTVPLAPTPFQSNGKTQLVYELHMDNFRAGDTYLAKLEVFGNKKAEALAIYQGAELEALLGRPGANQQVKEKRMIGPGLRAVVYLWLTLNNPEDTPDNIRHRLTFKLSGTEAERVVEGARIPVVKEKPLVIGPPFRGYGWVARFASNTGFHRRSFFPVNGHAVISQRFAIDWGKFNEDGKVLRTGDGSKNSDFYIYGEDLIAVADSVVSEVKDGIPENNPAAGTTAVPITIDTVAGNHVVLNLGNGRYALYAHLQTGSIKVKPGERVKRGQLLGKIGNSGNAVGPHLHFHITNSPAIFEGEGLPYVFTGFDVWAHETPEEFQKGEGVRARAVLKAEHHHLEYPSDSSVLSFP